MIDARFRSMCLVALTAMMSSPLIACGDADEGSAGVAEPGEGGAPSDDGAGDGTDPEAPASCDILSSVVGNYTVTGEPMENGHRGVNSSEHQRGTVMVGDDYGIDFDEDTAFAGADIATCYDRTNQDHDRRIQVSYDSDDSGRVINLYLTADGDVDEIQFRNGNEGVNVRVLVSKD